MDGKSLNITEEKINQLKEILPEAFTENKIDWEKLKAALGDDIEFKNERYVLNWAGKSDAFRALQTPSTDTLVPCKDESVNFDATGNIFIEGENLEVLKVLQKSYFGKIKMIYIDPPYNTGNDHFIYPDRFSESKDEYLNRIGDKDETGLMTREGLFRKNSKDSGHYHSNWLSMMYPRLFLARNLLRDDGVIFVSIDDNEVHNLRLLMNEVFGEENFRNAIVIKRGAKSVQMQFETVDKLGSGYETVLMYTKNANFRFQRVEKKLDEKKTGSWNNHWRGTDRPTMRYELFGIIPESGQWRWSRERSLKAIDNYNLLIKGLAKDEDENKITQEDIDKWYVEKVNENGEEQDLLRLSKNGKPEHYISPSETTLANDVWFDIPPNSTSILKSLFNFKVFDNPKPLELIKRAMEFFTLEDDII
ncbi:MAG: site-specific DNA-methyltransferase, partial [Smithella sp.]